MQYLDGTTDVTRTVHFGNPSAHERTCYTQVKYLKFWSSCIGLTGALHRARAKALFPKLQVLKGHIALDTAVFPNGTSGMP